MGNFRPIPMACFIRFLHHNGFKLDRIKASHHIYVRSGAIRSVVLQGNEKMVPPMHLQTNCRTIGCTMQSLMKWVELNC